LVASSPNLLSLFGFFPPAFEHSPRFPQCLSCVRIPSGHIFPDLFSTCKPFFEVLSISAILSRCLFCFFAFFPEVPPHFFPGIAPFFHRSLFPGLFTAPAPFPRAGVCFVFGMKPSLFFKTMRGIFPKSLSLFDGSLVPPLFCSSAPKHPGRFWFMLRTCGCLSPLFPSQNRCFFFARLFCPVRNFSQCVAFFCGGLNAPSVIFQLPIAPFPRKLVCAAIGVSPVKKYSAGVHSFKSLVH